MPFSFSFVNPDAISDPELAQQTFAGFSQNLTTQGVRPEAKPLDTTLCFSVSGLYVFLLSSIISKLFGRLGKVVNNGFLSITLPHVSFCFSGIPILHNIIFLMECMILEKEKKKQDH